MFLLFWHVFFVVFFFLSNIPNKIQLNYCHLHWFISDFDFVFSVFETFCHLINKIEGKIVPHSKINEKGGKNNNHNNKSTHLFVVYIVACRKCVVFGETEMSCARSYTIYFYLHFYNEVCRWVVAVFFWNFGMPLFGVAIYSACAWVRKCV